MSKELELPRNIENCRGRWKQVILPICKTYVLGNPGFPENYLDWKKDVVKYIVEHKIEDRNDVDAYLIEKDLCPGQTVASIKKFVNGIYQSSRKYDDWTTALVKHNKHAWQSQIICVPLLWYALWI